jgi:hypothetical protein
MTVPFTPEYRRRSDDVAAKSIGQGGNEASRRPAATAPEKPARH